jgi:ethanolamine ammonia-lyase small subunit
VSGPDDAPADDGPDRSPSPSYAAGVTSDFWSVLRRDTPARIALGRAGAGLPTAPALEFALAHARARDAVHTKFDVTATRLAIEALGFSTLTVHSQAPDRATYLRRPDLGRRLAGADHARLDGSDPVDLAIVVADGLSATAIHTQAAPFLAAFKPWIAAAGWQVGPVVIAEQGRVALGDEIGARLRARAVAILVGERPGLSSPDSLGIYLTFGPRVGREDAERNCLSNIRAGGLDHALAAFKLAWLLGEALRLGLTGVRLKDASEALLTGGRPPLPRLAE